MNKIVFEANGHTAECNQETACIIDLRELWKQRWPNYCQRCQGEGYISYSATREEPSETIARDCCLGEGKCPRCAYNIGLDAVMEADESISCPNCGWNGSGNDDIMPNIVECNCDYLLAAQDL